MACNIVFRLFRPAVVTQILSLRSASASLGKSAAVVTRTRLFSSDPPETISCFPVPYRKDLPYDIVELMEEIETKWGFLPNFFKVLSHRPAEFRAFYAYYNELMNQEAGSLTKADRELIVVATSMYNKCPYCVISHSAMHRIYSKNPALADQVVVNYQNAGLCRREHVMLDFAMAVCRCEIITEEHFQSLEAVGFDREDAWDIAAITAFFSMSNRFAQFTNLKPNIEFYNMARIPWNKLGKEAEEEWK